MPSQATPKRINSNIELLVNSLELDIDHKIFMKLKKIDNFQPLERHCHFNCLKQKQLHGGYIQFGWIIWQDNIIQFTEAEFHAVWKTKAGKLLDITPRVDNEKKILFISDPRRKACILKHDLAAIEKIGVVLQYIKPLHLIAPDPYAPPMDHKGLTDQ